MRWFHWLVMGLSLVLTLSAWWFTRAQSQAKAEVMFDRQAQRVTALVVERMQTYEDALRAANSMVEVQNWTSRAEWRAYAEKLDIVRRYPGINGIGVIEHVRPEDLAEHRARMHAERPGYAIKPFAQRPEYMPIIYVEPEATNAKAIGLDMTFEAHRYEAAKRARQTRSAQITGTIELVQGAKNVAGFLFFVPTFKAGRFVGFVYAPFFVEQLMKGTLSRARRQVDLVIRDGEDVLYDEHTSPGPETDPDPLYVSRHDVDLYGRAWRFEVRSTLQFRQAVATQQPTLILVGGLVIDLLLLCLFVLLTRSEHRAQALADEATRDLRKKTEALAASNGALSRFATLAAHDLQEPSRKIVGFLELLERRLGTDLDAKSRVYIEHAVSGARRMREHVQGVMAVAKVSRPAAVEAVDMAQVVAEVLAGMTQTLADAQVEFADLPTLRANRVRMKMLMQNLIGNASKYRSDDPLRVEVRAARVGPAWHLTVADNGIGIEPRHRDKVFEMFRRLHGMDAYSGSGIGLALCKMVVQSLGGTISVQEGLARADGGRGTCVRVELPAQVVASS